MKEEKPNSKKSLAVRILCIGLVALMLLGSIYYTVALILA